MIYSIHNQDPGTPDDDQRPGIARYEVGAYWVDAIGLPTLEEVEAYRNPPISALDQIRALEQTHIDDQRKLNRQAAIDTALTVACRSPAAEGKTRDEVHAIYYASNRGYKAMVDLEAQVAELRKQL